MLKINLHDSVNDYILLLFFVRNYYNIRYYKLLLTVTFRINYKIIANAEEKSRINRNFIEIGRRMKSETTMFASWYVVVLLNINYSRYIYKRMYI